MARRKTEQSPRPLGAVLKTTTTVTLLREEGEPRDSLYFGVQRTYHDLPLSALQDFVDAVHEVVGTGADELGSVTTDASGVTYTLSETIKENIK